VRVFKHSPYPTKLRGYFKFVSHLRLKLGQCALLRVYYPYPRYHLEMLLHVLLVLHIIVLGYWLGSELVINANFRFVTRAVDMTFGERDRLLDHVLDVDQHVRYALILQAGLGVMLCALLGYVPGGNVLAICAAILAAAWLLLVELTHRSRRQAGGAMLARIDTAIRYSAVALLITAGASAFAGVLTLPGWLAAKLLLFAAVILCGLGIRQAIVRYYETWYVLARDGSSASLEAELHRRYWQATTVLLGLWVLILAIVALSIGRPF
jgi:hypothetical protein